MANRAYLYSLDNRPQAYTDRPDTISGLSEWPCTIPFAYRVLLSGNPQLCASMISDGFEDEDPSSRTPLWAISGDFDAGYARLRKFLALASALGQAPSWHHASDIADAPTSPLQHAITDTLAFLDAHRNTHLLLETIELDIMETRDADALKALAEAERARCIATGAAIDALPEDPQAAKALLASAMFEDRGGTLSMLYGLRLDDEFDNIRDGATEAPLGLSFWDETLYFSLWNRAQFEAAQAG